MVVPGLLGYWLDSRFHTRPLLTVLGFALGMAYGMYQLVQLARGEQEQADRQHESESNGSTRGRE
jgi:F0F1-type ATP synthase assembly protein I